MKKTLLSMIAAVAVLLTVTACGNKDKEVDVQVKFITEAIAQIESVGSVDALNVIVQDVNQAIQEFGQKAKDWTVSKEKGVELETAVQSFGTAAQERLVRFQQAEAEAAAALAAELEAAAAAVKK